jgi:hypothetical protein
MAVVPVSVGCDAPAGNASRAQLQTQPVGFGKPAILHACLAGP